MTAHQFPFSPSVGVGFRSSLFAMDSIAMHYPSWIGITHRRAEREWNSRAGGSAEDYYGTTSRELYSDYLPDVLHTLYESIMEMLHRETRQSRTRIGIRW